MSQTPLDRDKSIDFSPNYSNYTTIASVEWQDYFTHVEITPPKEFDFYQCLRFLGRSANECLHSIRDGVLYKSVKYGENILLLKIQMSNYKLKIEFPGYSPDRSLRIQAAEYVWELFDLCRDIKPFYNLCSKDSLLHSLVAKYYGLRIVGIPDLFEALTWAILGQQINLAFAYTLKRRFVECFGELLKYEDYDYWLYPTPEAISVLEPSDLIPLQFTARKAEYIIGVAQHITAGSLNKTTLLKMKDYDEVKKRLVSIRGIGEWTADYALMKCLRFTSAFPIKDVGLHNALKNQLSMDRKPSIEEIEKLSEAWTGWEAYATFYLLMSLYE